MKKLSKELEEFRQKIEKVSLDYGLDFFETIFEVISYDKINEIAAYGGFPTRYPHWKFGMEYDQLSKSYEYGLSKIYEMVINTDPCYAYLMEGNSDLDQKLVMAHVYGHCDFFKNNVWFSKTDRKMVDTMANHAVRVRRYIDLYGQDRVERFIDQCLSLENLIDRFSPFDPPAKTAPPTTAPSFKLRVDRQYMDNYINPPEAIRKQKEEYENLNRNKPTFPANPEKDILKFLIDYAPLEDWQSDILSIIRNEAYYFSPQGMTKTMNEGWASYWHSKILTQKILNDSEIIDFASKHAGVMAMAPNGYNPYKVGIELMRDIEERWDKGRFGRDWEQCDNYREKENWDKKTNLGRQKIFEVRKLHNDVTFISEFLTEDFCVRNKMFVYKFNKKYNRFEVDTKDFKAIKNQLLFYMTNFGQPIISIENANYDNKGELLLSHLHEGMDLQPKFMEETLMNMFQIWKRPILIKTIMQEQEKIFRCDGISITAIK